MGFVGSLLSSPLFACMSPSFFSSERSIQRTPQLRAVVVTSDAVVVAVDVKTTTAESVVVLL